MEIQKVDPISFVRKNANFFFRGKASFNNQILSYLVLEALTLNAKFINIYDVGRWKVISADIKWFQQEHSAESIFNSLVPFPEIGPNETRFEILVNAFSENVICCDFGRVQLIKGSGDEEIFSYLNKSSKLFSIAFTDAEEV